MSNPLDSVWVEKYRPKTLSEIILPTSVRQMLEGFGNSKEIQNLLFYGRAGIGKTATAKVLCDDVLKRDSMDVLYINASDESGIDTIRTRIIDFAQIRSFGDDQHKVVILDEADGLSPAAQGALRGVTEMYSQNVRFILTANASNKIIEPIKSRTVMVEFPAPSQSDVVTRIVSILRAEGIDFAGQLGELQKIIKRWYPDLRKTINEVQSRCIGGTFVPSTTGVSEEVETLAKSLVCDIGDNTVNISELRSQWISKETIFGNDYLVLLKAVFEAFNANPTGDGRKGIVVIADAMRDHSLVADMEINFYACMTRLSMLS